MQEEYIIYCDESESKGKFFSNFYGGVVVPSRQIKAISEALNQKKDELNLKDEIKWSKVTKSYLSKYIELINFFFDFVSRGDVKIRVMFTQNKNIPAGLQKYHYDEEYFILYYYFVRLGFGLQYINADPNICVRIRLYFDKFPDERKEKVRQFKDYLAALTLNNEFKKGNVVIEDQYITTVNSHQHVILQCLDVILGAMHFVLNDKHLEKPKGQSRRSKRTIAKEKLYKQINKRIREIYPGFNIGMSTGLQTGLQDRWLHNYRHWLFVPTNHVVDSSRTKKSMNKKG